MIYILHFLDDSPPFSAALFLPNVSSTTLLSVLMDFCSFLYTYLPRCILFNHFFAFSYQFVSFITLSKINVSNTSIESHNPLGFIKCYQYTLQKLYLYMYLSFPHLKQVCMLSMRVKSLNETLGPEVVFPSSLVFGGVFRHYLEEKIQSLDPYWLLFRLLIERPVNKWIP